MSTAGRQDLRTRLQILVDDQVPAGLISEHGFSLWIEHGSRRLLFDAGLGQAVLANAQALGCDLGTVDTVLLSHGHYDHGGGLAGVLPLMPQARLVTHPACLRRRYSVRPGAVKDISLPDPVQAAVRHWPAQRRVMARAAVDLGDGLEVSGAIARTSAFEDVGGPFFLDPTGHHPDDLMDDIALTIDLPQGLVVCVGCAHAGIINTLHQVRRRHPGRPVHTVIGGLHLLQAGPERLRRSAAALARIDPQRVVACHCTGALAIQVLHKRLGERVITGQAGMVIDTW